MSAILLFDSQKEASSYRPKRQLIYKEIIGTISIFVGEGDVGGVSLVPNKLGRRYFLVRLDGSLFEGGKALSSGAVLATRFVHILLNAQNKFMSPCRGDNKPWDPMTEIERGSQLRFETSAIHIHTHGHVYIYQCSWYEPPYCRDYTLFAEEQIEANKVAIRERAKLLESLRKEKEFKRRLHEGLELMQKMLDDFQRERLEAEAKADKLVNDLYRAVELKRSLQSQDQMREINVQKEALEPKTNPEPSNHQVPVLEDSPRPTLPQKPESITTLARATMRENLTRTERRRSHPYPTAQSGTGAQASSPLLKPARICHRCGSVSSSSVYGQKSLPESDLHGPEVAGVAGSPRLSSRRREVVDHRCALPEFLPSRLNSPTICRHRWRLPAVLSSFLRGIGIDGARSSKTAGRCCLWRKLPEIERGRERIPWCQRAGADRRRRNDDGEFSTMGRDKSRAATSRKSKSKSRAPVTSSEERLYYGDGSYLWFDSEEERTRFLTFFSKRVVAPPRIVPERFPELQGYDDLDAQLHQAGLWPFVSRARKEINPALIWAFYSNLRREDDVIYSLVKSTPIDVIPKPGV
ncbi:unnamed protein product [Cuscuta campestris]|uniref:Uncharacterized protein n=1 Tax=Cuscuta campestris TaxID=132261 RepID=A0A484KZQ8_9ASTE|nr:unnamed protein product [Cuscuta campestris]